eukprot:contig_8415_g1972
MVVGQHHMLSIRRKLSEFLTQSIKNSRTSAEVYMDGASYSEKIKECVKEQLGADDAAVNDWLSSDIIKPTKGTAIKKKDNGKVARQTVRAETPLKAVLPHIIEALKKRVLLAYFKTVNVSMEKLSKRQVLQCLANNRYTDSDDRQKAICEAMVSMYAFLGALHRVEDGDIVGAGRVVRASIGFYALASCFVRYYLECVKTGTVNKPRTGTEPGWYVRWRAELIRVHGFLKKDSDVHNGLALTDGSDANRAVINTEEDNQVKIWHKRQADEEVNYPTRLNDAIEEENQREQQQQQQQQQQ